MIFEKQVVDMFKKVAYSRCDDKGTAYYFSAKDFDGLNCEPLPFVSSLGNKLSGYLYYYDNPIEKRLIVFEHGFWGGHRSYMKEIEMLCKHGFMVYGYDHTGCMESQGVNPNGLAQSLHDCDDCLKMLKSLDRFKDFDISVVGHSWGGYSTMNISALHPDVTHVVVLSGFVSVETLVNSMFSGILKPYRKAIMNVERNSNSEYVDYNGVNTLLNSKVKALLIYSSNDQLVKKNPHYDLLKENLEGKDNIQLLLVDNKGHNPNYSDEAVKYLTEFSKAKKDFKTEEEKKQFVASYDWNLMTKQDEKVWEKIFECLDA